MDSMRRMNAYVKLNFQRCLSQGKTLVICICLAVFFYTQSNQTSHEVVLLHPNATDRHVRTLFCA